MNANRARTFLGLVLPLAVLSIGFVPYLIFRNDLPSRVATHFTASGTPDGSMTVTGLLASTTIMMALGLLACAVIAMAARHLPPASLPIGGFLGGFIAGLGAIILSVTVLGQRDAESWQAVRVPFWNVLVLIAVSLGAGAIATRLAAELTPIVEPARQPGPFPAMSPDESETAVWSTTLVSRWLLYSGLAMLIAALVLGVAIGWPMAISLGPAGFITAMLGWLRVRADRSGLTVRYGLLPWPRTRIATAKIEVASAIDVRPREWGGWGYRGSIKLMKRAAIVHRAGPGLRLDLANGRVFVITIDDPETPACLLNAAVAHRAAI